MTQNNESKGNILLVDDLPENLQLLSDLLTRLGYTIRSVTSGRMALKTLKVKQPDVIFLDIKMPEMDGYQVCEAIKSDQLLQDIPIIFISALDDVFDKVRAFQCGGVDYITKPFQMEEVIARLEHQLTIQRQKTALQEEIRKRKEAEEVLYQSRALLSSVLNTALDGIAAMQAVRHSETGEISDFRCLVVNPVIAQILQQNRDDLHGRMILKKFLTRVQPNLFDRFVQVVEKGEPLEMDFYYPGSHASWYHFIAVKLGDGFAITLSDITSRKQMELELQEANRKLEILAHLDGLTQISNRRSFDRFLHQEWLRLRRGGQSIALILLDVDFFKNYNDTYGHQLGDECLIKIAQALQQNANRPADMVARYGGEEFAVILSDTDESGAIVVAQNIHQAIAQLQIPHATSEVNDYITVSIGIASLIPTVSLTPEYLIQLADQALYQAKQGGRNRYYL
jgi:diguanylate cyclase (GGDEF)-like protein